MAKRNTRLLADGVGNGRVHGAGDGNDGSWNKGDHVDVRKPVNRRQELRNDIGDSCHYRYVQCHLFQVVAAAQYDGNGKQEFHAVGVDDRVEADGQK